MGYIDNNLLHGEVVKFRTRMHWIIFFNPLFWSLLTVVIFYFFPTTPMLILPPLVVSIPLWVQQLISYACSEFAVTDKRLMLKVGWLSRYTVDLLLQRVESIQVEQSLLGRMLNYGTLLVHGTGGSNDRFVFVANPFGFRRAVEEQTEELMVPMNDK